MAKTLRFRLRSALRAAAFACALVLVPAVGGANEPVERTQPSSTVTKSRVGRIFFTPDQRRIRRAGARAAGGSTAMAAKRAPRSRLLVNGAVSSGSRAAAVWVNGEPVESSGLNGPIHSDRDGNVWVSDGFQKGVLVRPGESIGPGGVVLDLLPPGSVTRR
jgi:hypothetical protein